MLHIEKEPSRGKYFLNDLHEHFSGAHIFLLYSDTSPQALNPGFKLKSSSVVHRFNINFLKSFFS